MLTADLEPRRGAFVWAYDMAHFDGRTGVDPPAYVTQSGTDGGFRFGRLAGSRYRTIAFVDGNRNQRPDRGEPLGLAHGDIAASTDGEADAGVLVLAPREPGNRVQRISAVDRRRILLAFERGVEAADLVVEIETLPVEEIYALPTDSRRIHVVTAEQEPGRSYRASVRLAGRNVEVPGDPVRGTDREDRRPPEVVGSSPRGLAGEADSLVLTFSEAMDPSAVPGGEDWAATDSTSPPPAGRWRWSDPLSLAFAPEPPLEPGSHRLEVRLDGLRDRAGNAPQDSTAVFDFELLAASGPGDGGREGRVGGGEGAGASAAPPAGRPRADRRRRLGGSLRLPRGRPRQIPGVRLRRPRRRRGAQPRPPRPLHAGGTGRPRRRGRPRARPEPACRGAGGSPVTVNEFDAPSPRRRWWPWLELGLLLTLLAVIGIVRFSRLTVTERLTIQLEAGLQQLHEMEIDHLRRHGRFFHPRDPAYGPYLPWMRLYEVQSGHRGRESFSAVVRADIDGDGQPGVWRIDQTSPEVQRLQED